MLMLNPIGDIRAILDVLIDGLNDIKGFVVVYFGAFFQQVSDIYVQNILLHLTVINFF